MSTMTYTISNDMMDCIAVALHSQLDYHTAMVAALREMPGEPDRAQRMAFHEREADNFRTTIASLLAQAEEAGA